MYVNKQANKVLSNCCGDKRHDHNVLEHSIKQTPLEKYTSVKADSWMCLQISKGAFLNGRTLRGKLMGG